MAASDFFVEFDTLGREFRCKWSKDNGNASLKALDAVFSKHLPTLKAIEGVKSVKRVVCGECQDFKIIVEISAAGHDPWSKTSYSPETDILSDFAAIEGASGEETQTYTFMSF
jgi:hypothetical protein